MAPILSKAVPPPTRSSAVKIDRWIKRHQSVFDSIFDIMKDLGTMGRMCRGDAESVLDSLRTKLDTACVSGVRLLESLCCLDINRFAKPEKPLTGSLPILFVLMLVVMLYNAFVFGYMPAAGIALNSRTSLMFHAWIFLLLSSFAQAVRTDPGSTPMTSKWTDRDHPPAEARERKRCSTEARWCRKSNAYKPDRAHYCRVLKKGVLRMDHYCPWLGNTVGFHNQKFFFLFLFYTNAACAQMGISFIQLLVQYTLPALTTFCLVGAEGLTGLITSLLVPFFLFHFWLIARNTTTIEFCEKMRTKGEDDGDIDASLPPRYDLGIFHNICAVLGSNPLTWLLPVGGPPGDGINFPINPEYKEAVERAAAAARAATEVEQPASSTSRGLETSTSRGLEKTTSPTGSDEIPEDTHPTASNTAAQDSGDDTEKKEAEEGKDIEKDIEQASGEGDLEEGEEEASVESSEEASGSAKSDVGDDGFLVWRSSAEFVEDFTIGCQFIAEKTEDCTKNSFLCLVASCVPGTAWGRKAARGLAGTSLPPWKRSLTSRGYPEGSRASLRSSSPAVRIVPVRGGGSGALSSGEGEGEGSSGDFFSD